MRLVRSLVSVVLLPLALSSCTKDQNKAEEPVQAKPEAAASVPPKAPAPPPKPVPMPEETCRVFDKLPSEPPLVLDGKGVVLTRIMKPCVTRDGRRGFEKNSPYLAMGFPCTGGSGRIDIKGNYYNPKMVSFILAT